MKPPSFAYHRPHSVNEAVQTLAHLGSAAKVLAGGQSLVPMLNMRLAQPSALVDINGLAPELAYLRVDDDVVRVGALARHAQVERDPAIAASLPLLAEATRHVAHPAVRNRGTCVGSLVHADPAAELTAVLLLCSGEVELAGGSGTRTVVADQFFVGPLESAIDAGELAVAATFRRFPPSTGTCWLEVSRRAGDYALCGVAMAVTVDTEGRVASARAAYISVGPTPILVDLDDAVGGAAAHQADWSAAGALAAARVEPEPDIHASAEYRRHLVGVLTGRAGRLAQRRALPARAGEAQ